MRKLLILLLMAAATVFTLSACGGGSSGDPLGTDTLTFVGATQVERNGTVVLTATVKNASGNAVVGRDVTFGIVRNDSGATLMSPAEVSTDSAGVATLIYKAGGVSGVDNVRASLTSNYKVSRDVAITVGTGGTGELTLNVSPTIISLAAGAQTIITAQVLNEDGKPAAGQTVTFTTAPSGSGAGNPTPSSSTTNAAGKAFATYTAGSNSPGSTVFDVVTASVTTAGGSAAGDVIITRTAAAAGGITVNVTSSLSSLRAGAQTIITADVLNPNGTPAVGQTVTFTTDPNNSGAVLLPGSSTTNAAGKAFATYTAGNNSPGTTVYDVVTASIPGASSGVIITRTAAAAAGVTMSVTCSLSSLAAGGQSLIEAKVLNADGTPAKGQTVTFTTSPSNSGALNPTPGSALTNADGRAFATYTAGSLLPGTTVFDVVTASVTGAAGDAADSKIITRMAAAATGVTMTLTATPTSLAAGSQSLITAKVLNADGKPATGQTVTFTTSPSNSGALNPTPGSALTNADGAVFATYTAGSLSPGSTVSDVVTASVTTTSGSAAGSIIVTRSPATGRYLTVTATPTSLAAGTMSVIVARVLNADGTSAAGQTVTFGFATNNSGAALITVNGVTDANGTAVATYTAGSASPTLSVQDAISASVTGSAGAVVITRTASPAAGYRVTLSADTTTLAAGERTIIAATVRDSLGNAAVGHVVTFSILTNNSGAVLTTLNGTTDVNGRAVAIYTAGSTSPTISVQDTIQATATGTTEAIILTRTAAAPTGYQVALTATPSSLAAGSLSVISARITNASGNPVEGQTVTFGFVTNNSSAGLTIVNNVTDANGTAVAMYTAGGASATLSVQDSVYASVTGSARSIVITRTAGLATPGYRLSLSADTTTMAAGQSSVVTAVVTDASGNVAAGQTVTFTLLNNNSGATLTTLNGGTTDLNGRALTVYTAGANSSTVSVQDIVQASVTGSTGAIVMTRAAGAVAPGFRMTVTATPTTLIAGAIGIVIADVRNANGSPASGQTVTFGFVANNSGATLTPVNNVTDADGKALATYSAGSASAGLSIQDAVFASVTGSAGAVVITRLPAAGTGNRIHFDGVWDGIRAIAPDSLSTSTTYILRVLVVRDDEVTPVLGEAVTFSTIITSGGGTMRNPSGVVSDPVTVQSDSNGHAYVLFTTPAATPGYAAIRATITGGDTALVISW